MKKYYSIRVINSYVLFTRSRKSGCWICTSHGGKNYPRVGKGRASVLIYKTLWEEENGPVPDDKILLTVPECSDWVRCINPAHRVLGTRHQLAYEKMHPHRPTGENHHLHKLSPAKVRHILRSKETDVALGKKYGCSDVTINNVRHRKVWKHVKLRERRVKNGNELGTVQKT